MQKNVTYCYSTLGRLTGIVVPSNMQAEVQESASSYSYYSPQHNQIAISSACRHIWDPYFEEVAHALRNHAHNGTFRYDHAIQYHTVSEFFGGLGRMIGRAFVPRPPGPARWDNIHAHDQTYALLHDKTAWLRQIRETADNPPPDAQAFYQGDKKAIRRQGGGHALGYLLAENYTLPSRPRPLLKNLFSMAADDVIGTIFPSIITRDPRIRHAWDAICEEYI